MAAWFYKDELTSAKTGPLELEQLKLLIANGTVDRTTLVWSNNMSKWQKAETTELSKCWFSPPPLPPLPIGHGLIYAVALTPLLIPLVDFISTFILAATIENYADSQPKFNLLSTVLFHLIAIWLCLSDYARVNRAGAKLSFATFATSLLFIPIYLYLRSKAVAKQMDDVPSGLMLVFMWFGALALIVIFYLPAIE